MICVTYLAFYSQTQFNREQTVRQEKADAGDMIYEFIAMHNDNVANMRVTDQTSGTRAFHYMYYEFSSMQDVLIRTIVSSERWRELWRVDENGRHMIKDEWYDAVTKMAFKSFYAGVSMGANNNGLLDRWTADNLGDEYVPLMKSYVSEIQYLKKLNEDRLFLTESSLNPEQIQERNVLDDKKTLLKAIPSMYEYFISDQRFLYADGHMPTLDSHMRMLETVMLYFNRFDLTDAERDYYLDMIRSQFSSHELFVMFLYSLCETDRIDWFREGYVSKAGVANNLLRDVDAAFLRRISPASRLYMGDNVAAIDSLRKSRHD
ncbi:MAG: hypothetical protein LBV18_04385 [Alistipes sp.]|jgi:hypothetical protein|nr:hypothetical protein [Alistipes sp.]